MHLILIITPIPRHGLDASPKQLRIRLPESFHRPLSLFLGPAHITCLLHRVPAYPITKRFSKKAEIMPETRQFPGLFD
jgi:hypothetical protein